MFCVVCNMSLHMGVRGYGCSQCYIVYPLHVTEQNCTQYNGYTYRNKNVLVIGGTIDLDWCEKHHFDQFSVVDYVVFPELHKVVSPVDAITNVFQKCNTHTLIVIRMCTDNNDTSCIRYTVYGIKRLCDVLKLFVKHIDIQTGVYILSFTESHGSNLYDVLYSQLDMYSVF